MNNLTSCSYVYQIKGINMNTTNLVRKSYCWLILVHNTAGPNPITNTTSMEHWVFFVPITLLVPLALIFLSLPVTFQYPDLVALFVLLLLEFLKSRGLKKNHSWSSDLITENSAQPSSQKHPFSFFSTSLLETLMQKLSTSMNGH